MKKLFYLSSSILVAFAFLACSDTEIESSLSIIKDEVISFETSERLTGIDGNVVALRTISVVSGKNSVSHDNVYWAKEYTVAQDLRDKYDQLYFTDALFATDGGKTTFASYYCDCTIYGMQLDAWGGFVLSSNANKTVTAAQAGLNNQFDAYVEAGADGSKVFAVCYDALTAGMAMTKDCCWPQIDFAEPRKPLSIALANNPWTYHYFKGAEADSYVIRITGSKGETQTGSVDCPLISGTMKIADWKSFDLSPLGEVDRLVFKVISSTALAPMYFCVDNIVLKNNKQ